VYYNDEHLIERIAAEGNAVLSSAAETSQTDIAANHVELFFDIHDKESILNHVTCDGHAVVTSKPLPGPGRQPTETHTLRSESIGMKMRPGGRDIEQVSSHPPSTLEFQPNLPAQHHRTLTGNDMIIGYAPQSRIESFRATDVKTTTDPNDDEKKHNHGVETTASRELIARFDPQTSHMVAMEQKGDFTYQSGVRKARAGRATLDNQTNVMTLDTGAAVSDETGSTTADHIRMDQNTRDFTAEGNVNSVRQPDKSQKSDSSMLSSDTPMHAQAHKMESSNRATSHRTRYEGNALVWQGANRISADVVEIDRDKHILKADGNVFTQAWQQPKDDEKKKNDAAAVLTVVHAPHLVYTDGDRLAYYSGGVQLDRPDLHLKSKELHAWLADSKADSQLEKAFADGTVEISGARKDMTYNGTAEHAEYYTKDPDQAPPAAPQKNAAEPALKAVQKVILNGGMPKLVRTLGGKPTTVYGSELIDYPDDGNVICIGACTDRIPPKKK
jgi:lipopolysaccharide export system protein LptA